MVPRSLFPREASMANEYIDVGLTYNPSIAAAIAQAVAEERDRCLRHAENAAKAGEGGINITDGIPAEIYVAIGRGRYEDDGGDYTLAKDVADSIRESIAAAIRSGES